MYTLLIGIHVVACLVLILVVLLQAGKGGGLSGAFGVGENQTIFGSRAGDFLTKATTTCAIIYMTISLGLAILSAHRSASIMSNVTIEQPVVPADEEIDGNIKDISIPIAASAVPGVAGEQAESAE